MLTFRNTADESIIKVSSLRMYEGKIAAYHDFREPSAKWLQKYACVTKTEETIEDSKHGNTACRVFVASEGWEMVSKTKRAKSKKQQPKADASEVKTKLPYKTKQKEAKQTKTEETYEHPKFRELLALVKADRKTGRSPWLFGPAGSGKSTLCEAVAKELGLPFYSVSSLQQKYELEGYTDAAGEYVETTFFKAAKEGGVFLFDEAATTSPEVQIAFNSMLANLWYNFPKHGMVKAHPDFHVIAADNTTGRGQSKTYSSRFAVEASTLDRYMVLPIDYTDQHDLHMAHGDQALVDFLKAVRKAIEETQTTYLASPRTSKSLKAFQEDEDLRRQFNEKQALALSLCSGWKAQDIKTICTAAAQYCSLENQYMKTFQQIAKAAK